MKRINLLLIAASLLLFGSCNKDETAQEPTQKSFSPPMTATIDGEVNKTRAGVIEDNDNYASIGEQFYWSVGDASTLYFDQNRLDYTVASVGTQPNQANFTTTSMLGEYGNYNITGFFPTSAWEFTSLTATIPATQVQTDNSSAHLSNYMIMKAYSANATVNDKNAVDMSYKHLGAVVRISVWNASSNANLKLEKVELFALTSDGSKPFHLQGSLDNKSASSLTPDASSKVNTVGVSMTGQAQNFATKDGKSICEAYMALLPSTTIPSGDYIVVQMTVNDGVNPSKVIEDYFEVGTDLPFHSFEQGKSYYLRTQVMDSDLP